MSGRKRVAPRAGERWRFRTDFAAGFPEAEADSIDIGVARDVVYLRVGWADDAGSTHSREFMLPPDMARALAKQLTGAATLVEVRP